MNLFYAIYSAQERFVIQAINNSLFSLSILLSTVVVIIVKESYFAFAFTRFAIVAVFIFILARLTLKNITLKFSIRSLKVFLPQAYYFGLGSIYSNLLQRVNIIILSYMHGTLLSGFFSNAYMIFVTLFFIPTNLNKVLISHLYNFTYNEAPHKFQFAFDVYSKFFDIIAVGLAMPIFIFSSEIIVAIYGKNYLPAANILKITALAIPFLFNVSGIMLSAIDKQYVRTKCQKYSVMVNIVSCAILIFYFKGEGAAIATLATYLFLNFSYNMALKKFTTIRYYTSLLNKIKIFAIGLLLCSLVIQLHPQCHFLITTLALLISYCFFVYIFTITIKDLEVMRDIFGKIVPRKKYIFF
jgi:O-antigen/teichoic acid export membrane protein